MGFLKAYLLCVVLFLIGQMVLDAPGKVKSIVVESRKSETVQAVKSNIRSEVSRYVTGLLNQLPKAENYPQTFSAKKAPSKS